METLKKNGCEIWAVGGGKGGTGKSFVISCIGSNLASKGKRVVLIDADFGGANLHTFLGINKPEKTLTDFFEKGVPLSELIVDSGTPNMGLVIGNLHSLTSDSIKYTKKLKLLRQINSLDADYILIDLGGGTHSNIIDTFLLAHKMIVMTVPELIAIENMYHFIKNALFRKLTNSLSDHCLKKTFLDTWKHRNSYCIRNIKELIDYLMGQSSPIRDILFREVSSFKIHLILNQIRNSQEIRIGNSMKSVCMKYLGFHTKYVGYIEYDDCVSRCINRGQVFMRTYPLSRSAMEINKLTENILKGMNIRVENL